MASQIITLSAVLLGAFMSYLATTLAERSRHRKALALEWRQRKLESYRQYLVDAKQVRMIAQRIAAGVGLDDQAEPLTRPDGVPLLVEADRTRGVSFEMVTLLGNAHTVLAGRELNRAIWRLEWFARGRLRDDDTSGWHAAMRRYHQAIHTFNASVRHDLGVPGEYAVRRTEGSPRLAYERELTEAADPRLGQEARP